MAFFDKLGKSITEVSQKTIAKTKELADTSRLNSQISEQEKIIASQYLQIGKLYVSLHREDFEADFAGMIGVIADAEAKIRACKQQIQEIKGVQCCPNCGTEVPNGSAFCNACGASLPKVQLPEPAGTVKCASCGASVKSGMRFCTSCGKLMEAAPPLAEEEPAPEKEPKPAEEPETSKEPAAAEEPEPPTEPRPTEEPNPAEEAEAAKEPEAEAAPAEQICPNCGEKVAAEMAFCTECGCGLKR